MYTVHTLSEIDAEAIAAWRYEPPYHIYNMDGSTALLLDPAARYFGVYEDEILFAFCCFGEEGQVPGFDYNASPALDIGVGMDPSLIGRKRGRATLAAILAFGAAQYHPSHWRATIAAFNHRSQQMFRGSGFAEVARFVSTGATPREFVVVKLGTGD
ncbi:MAG: hypothetical protein R2856_18030 [Caldilineaceae bacterium]